MSVLYLCRVLRFGPAYFGRCRGTDGPLLVASPSLPVSSLPLASLGGACLLSQGFVPAAGQHPPLPQHNQHGRTATRAHGASECEENEEGERKRASASGSGRATGIVVCGLVVWRDLCASILFSPLCDAPSRHILLLLLLLLPHTNTVHCCHFVHTHTPPRMSSGAA